MNELLSIDRVKRPPVLQVSKNDLGYSPTSQISPDGTIPFYPNIVGTPKRKAHTYNALSRLTSAAVTGGPASYSESYSYSAATGNLESKGGWTLAYNDPDHVHAVTSAGGNSYGYNANGNQVTRVIGGSTYTLGYDAENRLVSGPLLCA